MTVQPPWISVSWSHWEQRVLFGHVPVGWHRECHISSFVRQDLRSSVYPLGVYESTLTPEYPPVVCSSPIPLLGIRPGAGPEVADVRKFWRYSMARYARPARFVQHLLEMTIAMFAGMF